MVKQDDYIIDTLSFCLVYHHFTHVCSCDRKKEKQVYLGLYFIVISVILIFFSLYYFKYHSNDERDQNIIQLNRRGMKEYSIDDNKIKKQVDKDFQKMFYEFSTKKQKR